MKIEKMAHLKFPIISIWKWFFVKFFIYHIFMVIPFLKNLFVIK